MDNGNTLSAVLISVACFTSFTMRRPIVQFTSCGAHIIINGILAELYRIGEKREKIWNIKVNTGERYATDPSITTSKVILLLAVTQVRFDNGITTDRRSENGITRKARLMKITDKLINYEQRNNNRSLNINNQNWILTSNHNHQCSWLLHFRTLKGQNFYSR